MHVCPFTAFHLYRNTTRDSLKEAAGEGHRDEAALRQDEGTADSGTAAGSGGDPQQIEGQG